MPALTANVGKHEWVTEDAAPPALLGQPAALDILLVLSLSFLLGLERERRKAEAGHYIFGGVRTFPVIGLVGYALARLAAGELLALVGGLAVVAAFLLLSFRHKIATAGDAGVTTEFTGVLTFLLGPLVARGDYWIATALVVVCVLLLEFKAGLEALSRRLPSQEVVTFTQFLLLTAVILPVVPNREFTQFQINPYTTWLVVVAVCGISYASYLLQRAVRQRGGVVLTAVLGGVYSSTVTTVALARRAAQAQQPALFAGAMVVASGMMYLRLAALLFIFNRALAARLAAPFIALGLLAAVAGALWARSSPPAEPPATQREAPRNPLEIGAAFAFAALFLAVLVGTELVLQHLGSSGVYGLALLLGVADVDPFILSLTQTAGTVTPVAVAAVAVTLAAAANNLAKGFYALAFADRASGRRGLAGLTLLSLAGLFPLLIAGE